MPACSQPAGQSCFRSCEAHEESTLLGKRGSVMLFLRGLPQDLTSRELKSYVQAAVRDPNPRAFAFTTAVGKCSILRLTDRTTGASELRPGGVPARHSSDARHRRAQRQEAKGVATRCGATVSISSARPPSGLSFRHADTVGGYDNRRQNGAAEFKIGGRRLRETGEGPLERLAPTVAARSGPLMLLPLVWKRCGRPASPNRRSGSIESARAIRCAGCRRREARLVHVGWKHWRKLVMRPYK
jgi:hypothetical protein